MAQSNTQTIRSLIAEHTTVEDQYFESLKQTELLQAKMNSLKNEVQSLCTHRHVIYSIHRGYERREHCYECMQCRKSLVVGDFDLKNIIETIDYT